MQVRGSIIKNIDQFVRDKHSANYENWKSKLNPETQEIIKSASYTKWYPVKEAAIAPTELLCEMFYPDEKKGAWEAGRYSADVALSGMYKIFVAVLSPYYLMKRAASILTTFYTPAELSVVENSDRYILTQITTLPENSKLLEYRIAGWMERAMEICRCKNVRVDIQKSLSNGDHVTELAIRWE